jgi:hypothetical protein
MHGKPVRRRRVTLSSKNVGIIALAAVALLASASAIWGWYHPKVTVQTAYMRVPTPYYAARVKTEYVEVEKVVVIEKEALAEKIDLPPEIADDPNRQITAVGTIEPWKGDTEVIATFNTADGKTSLVSKRLPPAFLAFENTKEFGARYGFSTEGGTEIEVSIRWTFLRVGSIYLAGYGEINKTPAAYGGLELRYQF